MTSSSPRALVLCSPSDGRLGAPLRLEDVDGLAPRRPSPAERAAYGRLVDAALAGARLCWGFDSLGDAMALLLAPAAAQAPRFGLAEGGTPALGVVEARVRWRDRSLQRPSPGSALTERGPRSPAEAERARRSIFDGALLVLEPDVERVAAPLAVGAVWDRVTRALVRATTDRRRRRRLAATPRTRAGWEQLWSDCLSLAPRALGEGDLAAVLLL